MTTDAKRNDYNPNPIKRTIKWQDIPIGIQHDEGDRRFPMAAPLHNVSYGCILGSYGSGEDGKSVDVYIGKDLESDRVYRIAQVDDFGNHDETKWAIGFRDIDSAEQAYRLNVPWVYFGGIKQSSIEELKKACWSCQEREQWEENGSLSTQTQKSSFGDGSGSGGDGSGSGVRSNKFRVVDSSLSDLHNDNNKSDSNRTNKGSNRGSKMTETMDSDTTDLRTDSRVDFYHRGLFDFDAHRLDAATKVQSILFEKSKWTLAQAIAWAKKHKFNIVKADPESDDASYIHIRVLQPSVCKGKERTIEFSKAKGIIARVCIP